MESTCNMVSTILSQPFKDEIVSIYEPDVDWYAPERNTLSRLQIIIVSKEPSEGETVKYVVKTLSQPALEVSVSA